jgi:hypothetical protein
VTNAEGVLLCRRCGRAVEISAAQYEIFEQMPYVCFHYEFEHGVDPDRECQAGGCPSGALGGGREAVAATARRLAEEAGGSPGWENGTLPAFLEVLSAWLDDCPGYYASQRRVLPSDAWTIINDALRAATVYE